MRNYSFQSYLFLTIAACLSFLPAIARTQAQVSFQHFSVENGLSQNTVMAILQDRKGFMWFGTWDGLNKFDGYEFTIYKSLPGDKTNITTNRIDYIHEDQFGYIWIQTYDGKFHRFNPETEQFYSFALATNRFNYGVERKKRLVESICGEIWIATDDIGLIRVVSNTQNQQISTTEYNTFSKHKIESNTVHFILEDLQDQIWLGTSRGLQSINKRTNQVKSVLPVDTSTPNAFFSGFLHQQHLYFGDANGTVWIYNTEDNRFNKLELGVKTVVTDIKALNNQHLIITTERAGFFVYQLRNGQLRQFSKTTNNAIKSNFFNSVNVDSYQTAWLESDVEGVLRYRLSDHSVKHFQPQTDAVSRISVLPNFKVFEDVNQRLWINPQGGGFSYYNREKDELEYFYNRPGSADYRFSNVIHTAYSDKNGNLWMCTYNKGLEKVSFTTPKFKQELVNKSVKSITSNEVRAIYQLSNNNIIIATKDGMIRFFDRRLREIGILNEQGTLQGNRPLNDLAYCIREDSRKNIWIGTKGTGLIQLIPERPDAANNRYTLRRFRNNPLDNNSLSNDNIYSIIEDNQQRIVIGTFGGGLNILDEKDGQVRFINYRNQLTSYPIQSCSKIRHLLLDNDQTLWVATTNGLLQIDHFMTDQMKEFYIEKVPNIKSSLGNNDVHYLHMSKDKQVWLGTFGGGLNRLVKKASANKAAEFEIFTTKAGLYSDIVLSILEDEEGHIWLTSENSISRFDPKSKIFQNYEVFVGLSDAHFSEAASLITQQGEMLFGNNQGFTFFTPKLIQPSTAIPSIEFTRFQLFNQDVTIGDKKSPLQKSITYTHQIKLTHRQSVFSIEYAALDFSNAEKINYAFMLEGFENEWNYVQRQRKATYTNLPKGSYNFKVRSTNNEGVWVDNEKVVKIIILPSFWETPVAYVIYFLLFMSILYLVFYLTRTFVKLRQEVEIEQKVSDIKLRFFTNISHELRTPLTLITGPVEQIMKHEKLSESVKEQLGVVQGNAERMLRLINQILDFRKIQHKKMRLKIQAIRIDQLVKSVFANFKKEAADKKINFVLDNQVEDAILWLDPDKTDMILYNLLSNAFKFTPAGKSITVRLIFNSVGDVQIQVIDEGVGIPREKRSFLFERFTSANEIQSLSTKQGSGIGLNLVKELVDLHKGNIEVESEPGSGTTFTVTFLSGKAHYSDDVDYIFADDNDFLNLDEQTDMPDFTVVHEQAEISVVKKELPLLLVVEDNEEMQQFLRNILARSYRVALASDGKEGLDKAFEIIPDLIITDLMMPNMDGLELTEQLKNSEHTNHIPVVLLTAKSAIESRLTAMKFGADDYITKPFSPVLLEARIENIIEQRKRLQEAYRRRLMGLEPARVDAPSQDEKFIARLLDFMDANIDNSELTVEEMVSEMAMGRTVFFNKLKHLTGLAPIEFIRELRIKRAAQLLRAGEHNISQITYMVGMSDSRYFSKCFKKVYGVTPSEYKKMNEEKD